MSDLCFENAWELYADCMLGNCDTIVTTTTKTTSTTSTTTTTSTTPPFDGDYYDVDFGDLGTIRGYLHPEYSDVVVMQGIPFMKPPVGDLRWKAPIIERSLDGYPRSQIIDGQSW